MIRYHIALCLILSIATIQGADQEKIQLTFSILRDDESIRSELPYEIDLTEIEANTKETFGNLLARAQARGTPWLITTVLMMTDKGHSINCFDLIELVKTYNKYSQNDFHSFKKTKEVVRAAVYNFPKKAPLFYLQQSKVLYENQKSPQFITSVDYNLAFDNSYISYDIKVTDLQAILAIALCEDYSLAGALQFGLQARQRDEVWEHNSVVAEEFWNNLINKRLPEETFQKACQQFSEAYPR